jgi:hypothetical protein
MHHVGARLGSLSAQDLADQHVVDRNAQALRERLDRIVGAPLGRVDDEFRAVEVEERADEVVIDPQDARALLEQRAHIGGVVERRVRDDAPEHFQTVRLQLGQPRLVLKQRGDALARLFEGEQVADALGELARIDRPHHDTVRTVVGCVIAGGPFVLAGHDDDGNVAQRVVHADLSERLGRRGERKRLHIGEKPHQRLEDPQVHLDVVDEHDAARHRAPSAANASATISWAIDSPRNRERNRSPTRASVSMHV